MKPKKILPALCLGFCLLSAWRHAIGKARRARSVILLEYEGGAYIPAAAGAERRTTHFYLQ